MLTKAKLIKAFNDGHLEIIFAECRKFGTVTLDKKFKVETGFYAGDNWRMHINHKNLEWRFELTDGTIKRVSYTVKYD